LRRTISFCLAVAVLVVPLAKGRRINELFGAEERRVHTSTRTLQHTKAEIVLCLRLRKRPHKDKGATVDLLAAIVLVN